MIKQNKEKQESNKEKEAKKTAEKSQKTNTTDNYSSETEDQENKVGKETEEPMDNSETVAEEKADEKDIIIKELQKKNDDLNDRYLRLFSEFDNFRKRTLKEKQELVKTASADIIEAVLPIVDDLDRAYKSAVENPEMDTLTEGLNLIRTKLNTTLKHKGLEQIPSIGEEFNTDYHEAITHVPAEDKKDKGKVIDEVQKGYILNGKVLRFAKVVVAN